MEEKASESDKFFAKYKDEINDLIEKYEQWKGKRWIFLLKKSSTLNRDLREKITEPTKAENWWISGDGRTLGIWVIDDSKGKVGIISRFDYNDSNNPVGICNIQFILTKSNWKYEQEIRKKFPQTEIRVEENKNMNLKMPPIEFKDEESYNKEIIDKLKEYYNFLKEKTDNIDK